MLMLFAWASEKAPAAAENERRLAAAIGGFRGSEHTKQLGIWWRRERDAARASIDTEAPEPGVRRGSTGDPGGSGIGVQSQQLLYWLARQRRRVSESVWSPVLGPAVVAPP